MLDLCNLTMQALIDPKFSVTVGRGFLYMSEKTEYEDLDAKYCKHQI